MIEVEQPRTVDHGAIHGRHRNAPMLSHEFRGKRCRVHVQSGRRPPFSTRDRQVYTLEAGVPQVESVQHSGRNMTGHCSIGIGRQGGDGRQTMNSLRIESRTQLPRCIHPWNDSAQFAPSTEPLQIGVGVTGFDRRCAGDQTVNVGMHSRTVHRK